MDPEKSELENSLFLKFIQKTAQKQHFFTKNNTFALKIVIKIRTKHQTFLYCAKIQLINRIIFNRKGNMSIDICSNRNTRMTQDI